MNDRPDIGLYVHVPFCRQRCHFCAFYLEIARVERLTSFLSALENEIRLYGRQGTLHAREFRSIYFGGGTPTVIPAQRLASLLTLARETFPTASDLEVTVEAHPATVTPDDLSILAEAGVNRISFGAESMNERELIPIGRPGSVQDTATAVGAAKTAGFSNINLDLMYGLPGQTLESWEQSLRSAIALEPAHISCYALTVEDNTKLAHDIAQGMIAGPDESLQIEMDRSADTLLTDAGFGRYEISNYAKPGFACRHNMLYWTDCDYLGLGPSAQSFVDGSRFGSAADLTRYIDRLRNDALPVSERIGLSPFERERDALIFGLRLSAGVPLRRIERHLTQRDHRHKLNRLIAQGLLEIGADRMKLSPTGKRYADTVAEELF